MRSTTAYRISAGIGFLAVALGAFGAHGLKDVLARHDTTAIWQTAVLYHLVHAVVLLALTLVPGVGGAWRRGPWWSFVLGLLIFSGSLYLLAVTGVRRLGAVTPIGGVLLLVGWAWLMASRPPKPD